MTADTPDVPVIDVAAMVHEAQMRYMADLRDTGAVLRWKHARPFWACGCFDKHPIARARLERK